MAKEKKVRRDYAGTERSPYWDHLMRRGNFSQEQDQPESAEANPDMVSENKSLYHVDRRLIRESDIYQYLLSKISTLSPKQKEALHLVGYEGRSYAEAGKAMNVSKSRIRDLIREARRKLQ